MSICDISLTSGSRYCTNHTLISSWHRHDNGRYPAERNPLGSYATLVSVTIIPRLHGALMQLKNKALGEVFLSSCYKKFIKHFQTALLYLKVFSNIVSGNT